MTAEGDTVVERAPVQPGPSGRLILLAAAAIVVVLAAAGVALYIAGSDQTLSTPGGGSDSTGTTVATTSTPVLPSSDHPSVTSEVSFGTGGVVTESAYVVFDDPVSTITLTVQDGVESVAGRTFHPRIGNLQILTGEGTPVTVTTPMGEGDSVSVDLPSPSLEVNLVYTAYRSLVRISPAAPDEGIALVTPLAVSPLSGATTTIHLNDTSVTNVGCVHPDGTQEPCGLASVNGWTVKRGPSEQDTLVIAELSIPH